MKKRDFLKNLLLAPAAFPTMAALKDFVDGHNYLSDDELAKDEIFWSQIRGGYRLKPDYINLENGYYCMIPQYTLEKYIEHIRHVNYQASYYMRTVQVNNKRRMAAKLAKLVGAQEDEIVITRNTTESLDMIIGGVHWQKGDEAVFAQQDYGAMQNMFRLQEKKHGIINKIVSVPNHPKNDEEIVDLYAAQITDKTRLLMVCHIINITGHILPIRKICDMAHSKGVEVMVDGAHAVGHFEFKMSDLNCDYYGSSLHKWLSVPLGSGLLYVKSGKAKNIWPLLASGRYENHIHTLNHTGTHPAATDLAVADAIDYHNMIGPSRKEARMRYIQRYWSDQLRGEENVVINTPEDHHRSCGIANVGLTNIPPKEMAKRLIEDYNIWTVAIDGANVHGCRISPNVYTTTEELDVFVDAVKKLSKV